MARPTLLLAVLFILGACAQDQPPPRDGSFAATSGRSLFEAPRAVQDEWLHMQIKGQTEYRLAHVDGRIGIRARGQGGASGLARWIEIDSERCPWIE